MAVTAADRYKSIIEFSSDYQGTYSRLQHYLAWKAKAEEIIAKMESDLAVYIREFRDPTPVIQEHLEYRQGIVQKQLEDPSLYDWYAKVLEEGDDDLREYLRTNDQAVSSRVANDRRFISESRLFVEQNIDPVISSLDLAMSLT